SVGVSVPLGRYQRVTQPRSLLYESTELRPGQHVWITLSDGRTVTGAVGQVTDATVEVRDRSQSTYVSLYEIRRIQIPDSINDGVSLGGKIGAGAGAALGVMGAMALCEYGCHGSDTLGVAAVGGVFAGLGWLTGAMIGAIADSLHETRHTVFDAE